MGSEREMTLKEWVERLAECHLARREYEGLLAEVERLRAALELIESMKPDEAEMEAAHVARQALGEK